MLRHKYGFVRSLVIGAAVALGASLASAQIAFPEAEGYGKNAKGGRGGAVYEVTNLNATGTGSLGAAIDATGPRTVVFRVGGTITGNFDIRNGFITIAGQTAPGDGICIKGRLFVSADNVIIRYIRVRNDPVVNPDSDAFGGRFHRDIIFDHISASWSTDEVFTFYGGDNISIQWCLSAEACPKAGADHRFAGVWGNRQSTYHHNLLAHCESRMIRFAGNIGNNDYRNNVIYNWRGNSCYGGEKEGGSTTINMVNNYYKPGPATPNTEVRYRICNPSYEHAGLTGYGMWYVAGNHVVGNSAVTADNWNGGVQPGGPGGMNDIPQLKLTSPWASMPINQQTAQDAYLLVLDKAGCYIPNRIKRDKVDADVVNDVRNGTGTYGNAGIIDSPSQVGGWPALANGTAPTDTDHDGMPDSWETANGLNPNNAADRNNLGAGGYTMLEIYINSLTGGNVPPSVSITSPTNGATFPAPSTITINANASDSDGTITKVDFYQGSTLLGTDTSSPYSFTWSNVAAGSYSLTARATDNGGTTTTSSAVNITVGTPPAGNITWNAVQSIAGDTDVSTAGTLVRAANLTRSAGTYDTNVSLNGVTFVRAPYVGTTTTLANGDTLVTSDGTAIGSYEGFGGATAPFNSLSTNYQTLLRSGHYNDGDLANTAGTARITLTLKNLTVGTKYQVQIWVNDYRVVNLGQSNPGLVTVVADSAGSATLQHNVNNALGGKGQYVIGTFTANATSKAITLTGGNTGSDTSAPNCTAIWNAYQLRVVP